MHRYKPVQYNGPLKIDEVKSLTQYQAPNTEEDRRIDDHILQAKPYSYPKNPVPILDSPYLDTIPHDSVRTSGLLPNENQRVFLENGADQSNGRLKPVTEKEISPLANHPVAQIFVGCITVLGLFAVFRALKL